VPSVGEPGLVRLTSKYPFAETISRLESAIASKGLTLFAKVDFSGDAARAGMTMNPTLLLVFGSPKAGTPLIVASPTLAIDLPLKVLVSQDTKGQVWASYNSLEYLRSRHDVPDDLLKNIAGIEPLVRSAVGA